MPKRIIILSSLLVVIGLGLVAFGQVISFTDRSQRVTIEIFVENINVAKEASLEEKYDTLAQTAQEWIEISNSTKNYSLKWKSLYNSGRANLTLFEKDNREGAYRASRGNFRQALRENPDDFESKYNLSYLENLAQKRGINPDEIPSASGDSSTGDALGVDASAGAGGSEEEQVSSNNDLRDKILGGSAPGLGGSAPLDITVELDPTEIPQKPNRAY
jgi:hypothetical protein